MCLHTLVFKAQIVGKKGGDFPHTLPQISIDRQITSTTKCQPSTLTVVMDSKSPQDFWMVALNVRPTGHLTRFSKFEAFQMSPNQKLNELQYYDFW